MTTGPTACRVRAASSGSTPASAGLASLCPTPSVSSPHHSPSSTAGAGDFLGELKTILVDHEVTRVVVGLPVSLSGRGRTGRRGERGSWERPSPGRCRCPSSSMTSDSPPCSPSRRCSRPTCRRDARRAGPRQGGGSGDPAELARRQAEGAAVTTTLRPPGATDRGPRPRERTATSGPRTSGTPRCPPDTGRHRRRAHQASSPPGSWERWGPSPWPPSSSPGRRRASPTSPPATPPRPTWSPPAPPSPSPCPRAPPPPASAPSSRKRGCSPTAATSSGSSWSVVSPTSSRPGTTTWSGG